MNTFFSPSPLLRTPRFFAIISPFFSSSFRFTVAFGTPSTAGSKSRDSFISYEAESLGSILSITASSVGKRWKSSDLQVFEGRKNTNAIPRLALEKGLLAWGESDPRKFLLSLADLSFPSLGDSFLLSSSPQQLLETRDSSTGGSGYHISIDSNRRVLQDSTLD
jgi:hypothetical protein